MSSCTSGYTSGVRLQVQVLRGEGFSYYSTIKAFCVLRLVDTGIGSILDRKQSNREVTLRTSVAKPKQIPTVSTNNSKVQSLDTNTNNNNWSNGDVHACQLVWIENENEIQISEQENVLSFSLESDISEEGNGNRTKTLQLEVYDGYQTENTFIGRGSCYLPELDLNSLERNLKSKWTSLSIMISKNKVDSKSTQKLPTSPSSASSSSRVFPRLPLKNTRASKLIKAVSPKRFISKRLLKPTGKYKTEGTIPHITKTENARVIVRIRYVHEVSEAAKANIIKEDININEKNKDSERKKEGNNLNSNKSPTMRKENSKLKVLSSAGNLYSASQSRPYVIAEGYLLAKVMNNWKECYAVLLQPLKEDSAKANLYYFDNKAAAQAFLHLYPSILDSLRKNPKEQTVHGLPFIITETGFDQGIQFGRLDLDKDSIFYLDEDEKINNFIDQMHDSDCMCRECSISSIHSIDYEDESQTQSRIFRSFEMIKPSYVVGCRIFFHAKGKISTFCATDKESLRIWVQKFFKTINARTEHKVVRKSSSDSISQGKLIKLPLETAEEFGLTVTDGFGSQITAKHEQMLAKPTIIGNMMSKNHGWKPYQEHIKPPAEVALLRGTLVLMSFGPAKTANEEKRANLNQSVVVILTKERILWSYNEDFSFQVYLNESESVSKTYRQYNEILLDHIYDVEMASEEADDFVVLESKSATQTVQNKVTRLKRIGNDRNNNQSKQHRFRVKSHSKNVSAYMWVERIRRTCCVNIMANQLYAGIEQLNAPKVCRAIDIGNEHGNLWQTDEGQEILKRGFGYCLTEKHIWKSDYLNYCKESLDLVPELADNDPFLVILKTLKKNCKMAIQQKLPNGDFPLHYVLRGDCFPFSIKLFDLLTDTDDSGIVLQQSDLNNMKETPLHIACHWRRLYAVKKLLGLDSACVKINNAWNQLPIHCVVLPIAINRDNNLFLKEKKTELEKRTIDIIQCLVAFEPFKDQVVTADRINGSSPLHYACQNSSLEVVKYVMSLNPKAITVGTETTKNTPFHLVCARLNQRDVHDVNVDELKALVIFIGGVYPHRLLNAHELEPLQLIADLKIKQDIAEALGIVDLPSITKDYMQTNTIQHRSFGTIFSFCCSGREYK